MKIEKLSDSKIRIIFSIQELEKENIDYHSFMSNSIENKFMFTSLLCKARDELDFNTDNCKVSVETFELCDGNFILTITKLGLKNKKVTLKRKVPNIHNNSCIYQFNNMDNFCDFCEFLKNSLPHILEKLKNKNSLFKINNNYFLVINHLILDYKNMSCFSSTITEFATFTNNSDSLTSKLFENSQCIIKNNAINTCLAFLI